MMSANAMKSIAKFGFIYTSLHLFKLATAKPSKMCLVYTKAEDVVGITYC